jgi:hypothetical protein
VCLATAGERQHQRHHRGYNDDRADESLRPRDRGDRDRQRQVARVGEAPVLDAEPGQDQHVLHDVEATDHNGKGDHHPFRPLQLRSLVERPPPAQDAGAEDDVTGEEEEVPADAGPRLTEVGRTGRDPLGQPLVRAG